MTMQHAPVVHLWASYRQYSLYLWRSDWADAITTQHEPNRWGICNRTTRSTQPCFTPGSLNRMSALIGWGRGGNVTSAEWQVTLCDHVWHVSSRSSEACARTTILLFILLYFTEMMTGNKNIESQSTHQIFKKIASKIENAEFCQRWHGCRKCFEQIVTKFYALKAAQTTPSTNANSHSF